MRRVLSWVSVIGGFTLIFVALFLRVYAAPRIEKAPTDADQTIISNGAGTYFSPGNVELIGPVPLKNEQIVKGEPGKSTDTVAVISYFSRTVDARAQPKGDVSYTKETFAMDRKTGLPVHCCGEKPQASGQTLKFPFDTQKTSTYTFWDPQSAKAYPAKYLREEDLKGLSTYVFLVHSSIVALPPLEIPGTLVGEPDSGGVLLDQWYQTDITLWIEPTTGAIIKGNQRLVQYLADDTGARRLLLANLILTYDDASVRKNIHDVTESVRQLRLVTTSIPIFGPVIGIVLVVLGLIGLRRRRPRRTAVPTSGRQAQAPAGA